MDVPDVSYAESGDVAIAYQVVGDRPPDLVFLPFLSNLYTLRQGIELEDRGAHELKGVPGEWRLFAVSSS